MDEDPIIQQHSARIKYGDDGRVNPQFCPPQTLSQPLQRLNQTPLNESDHVFKTQLDLEPITLVSDALLLAIDAFNRDLEPQGKALVKNIDFYIPRLPKKNGKAKTDMPCLDINQKLADIKLTSIAIQIKQPEKAILSKKLEHEDYPTKKSDTKSTIMVEMSDRSVKSSKKYSEEIEDEHELAKAEKQNSCFCSFC